MKALFTCAMLDASGTHCLRSVFTSEWVRSCGYVGELPSSMSTLSKVWIRVLGFECCSWRVWQLQCLDADSLLLDICVVCAFCLRGAFWI